MIGDIVYDIPTSTFDYVYLKNRLKGYAQPRRMINELLKREDIIRVKKGLYVLGKRKKISAVNKYHLANLIYGPSYVSLQSALSFYQLIPEAVYAMTSVTFKRKKTFRTPIGEFTYHTVPKAFICLGSTQVEMENGNVLMATPEKALLDLIWLERKTLDMSNLEAFLYQDLRLPHGFQKTIRMNRLSKLSKVLHDPVVDLVVKKMGEMR